MGTSEGALKVAVHRLRKRYRDLFRQEIAETLGDGEEVESAVSVRPTSGLSEEEVGRLVGEAEKFKETDEFRRELAELRNQAETLIYTTEQALEGYADLLEPERVAGVQADLASLRETLESGADLQAIRDAYSRLESATFQIAEAMYGSADETGSGATGGT
jgi:molecular chaperone DnaK